MKKLVALTHKVWRETRTAFFAWFGILTVNCWICVNRTYSDLMDGRGPADPSCFDVYNGAYRVWGVAFAFLGAGCLLWEYRQGTREFTRSLPIFAGNLNFVRGMVGIFHIAALSFLPAMVVNLAHSAVFPEFPVPVAPWMGYYGASLGLFLYGVSMIAGALIPNLYLAAGAGWLAANSLNLAFWFFPVTRAKSALVMMQHIGFNLKPPVDVPAFYFNIVGRLFFNTFAA